MAKRCIVPGCTTKRNEGVTFFNVPASYIMRKTWERRIGVPKLAETDLLCAKHFKLKDVLPSKQNGNPSKQKLRMTAVPFRNETEGSSTAAQQQPPPQPPPSQVSQKKKRNASNVQSKKDVLDPKLEEESLANRLLANSSKKAKKKRTKPVVVDPLAIKNEVTEYYDNQASVAVIHSTVNNYIDYVDSQTAYQSLESADVKLKDRLAALEAENLQLKTKYSQLISDYVQMKTEKIQLKAELDAALAANQKLIIVKNSLVTTIQTMGKMSDVPVRVNGIPATIQLDPSVEVSDTIIGF